jgi:guanosine-3',5'-bis(diphosphate) 3'-pyrophosphohydrolase
MDSIAEARAFAVAAHGDQRYGERPYVAHLEAVAALVRSYGSEAERIAYLHDVAEDTSLTLDDLRRQFGARIADHVALLTDEPDGDRAARKARSHAKLAKVPPEMNLALVVKAADRLANLRESVRSANAKKLATYRGEHAEFRAAAFRPGLCDELWREIDSLIEHGSSPT